MEFGLTLFTSDRGIRPTTAAVAAERAGFSAFYVPEHTHIPVRREAAHPGTGGAELPDERYSRTLDPWVALGAAAAVTSTIRLGTAVSIPVESDPVTLAKTIASVDHLSDGRTVLGVGYGWNLDEMADHNVPSLAGGPSPAHARTNAADPKSPDSSPENAATTTSRRPAGTTHRTGAHR